MIMQAAPCGVGANISNLLCGMRDAEVCGTVSKSEIAPKLMRFLNFYLRFCVVPHPAFRIIDFRYIRIYRSDPAWGSLGGNEGSSQ